MFRALFAAFLTLSCTLSGPAMAEEPAEEPSFLEAADAQFGKWVVGPLASVMFYDLMFWDNTLALGDGIGRTLDIDGVPHVVTEYGDAGYVLTPIFTAEANTLVALLEAPIEQPLGSMTMQVRSVDGALSATLPAQPVDLLAMGIEVAEGTTEPVEVSALVPFPVQVDPATGLSIEMDVPGELVNVPVVAGMNVQYEGAAATVASINDQGLAELRGSQTSTRSEALTNHEDTQVKAVVAWLVFGALILTFWMRFINLRLSLIHI